MRIGSIDKKPIISGYPYFVITLQQVSHIKPLQLAHHRSYLLTDNLTVTLGKTVKTSVNTCPYRTILLDVLNTHIWGITDIAVMTDITDIPPLIKGIAIDGVNGHLPYGTFGIVIDGNGGSVEHPADIFLTIRRGRAAHRPHIDNISTFIVCYPKTLEQVFRHPLT